MSDTPAGAQPPTEPSHEPPGYAHQSYPAPPPQGYPPPPPQGYPPPPPQGYPNQGYPNQGYPNQGYPPPPGGPYPPLGYAAGPTAHLERAGFGARLGGWLIDGLIVGLLAVLAGIPFVIYAVMNSTFEDRICTDLDGTSYTCEQPTDETALLWLGLLAVWSLIYLVIVFFIAVRPVAKSGQTIGRRVANIKVISSRTGGLLSTWAALGRFLFAGFISGQVLYLGYLWMLWDGEKRTWHDMVVNSAVVKV